MTSSTPACNTDIQHVNTDRLNIARHTGAKRVLAHRTLINQIKSNQCFNSMIGYWHDTAVCLSVCLAVCDAVHCIMVKQYPIANVSEQENRKCP